MELQDNPEAFLDLFEHAAEARGWPEFQWAAHLLPFLSGEAQFAAQQFPVMNLLEYPDLKWAILQRVGHTPEQHHQCFCSLTLSELGYPFTFAQEIQHTCRRWLLAEGHDAEGVVDLLVLEEFVG